MITDLLAAAGNVEYDSVTGNIVPRLGYGEVFLFALIGFAVVFIGILILIFVVWLCGLIVKRIGAKKAVAAAPAETQTAAATEEELSAEVRAAIIAAVAAYYAGEESSCEFKVKRIRRL